MLLFGIVIAITVFASAAGVFFTISKRVGHLD